uniref:Uncharacterized protein n=1 Tax=Lepeophtheirus salmonis TaxID=72036 RepID=A0A0K2V4C4_LEPSM
MQWVGWYCQTPYCCRKLSQAIHQPNSISEEMFECCPLLYLSMLPKIEMEGWRTLHANRYDGIDVRVLFLESNLNTSSFH